VDSAQNKEEAQNTPTEHRAKVHQPQNTTETSGCGYNESDAAPEAAAGLTHDPGNTEAAKIKIEAETQLAELDRLLVQATRAMAAGDAIGAAGLLARAQELAPGDARVAAAIVQRVEVEAGIRPRHLEETLQSKLRVRATRLLERTVRVQLVQFSAVS